MYYCPKCDRTIPKEKLEERDTELRQKFGVAKLSVLRCPVCDCEFIDLDKCSKGGVDHVGKTRTKGGTR
jgi:ssDNA-binding Zn-finger/Zn-ribbon topoisomerase 1